MKSLLLSSVALAALSLTPALAADLPTKAPAYVPAPPHFSWTGFYVGGSVGFISQQTRHTDLDGMSILSGDIPGSTFGVAGTGFIGGVNVGYNWQFAPNWVLGIEADISGTSLSNTESSIGFSGCRFAFKSKLSALGTVRGRIGYAFDRALLYATGGLAYGRVENSVTNDSGEPGQYFQSKVWKTGWTAGGGLEYAFTNNWTARVEGLYVDLGTTTAANNSGCRFSFRNRYGIGRVGMNYKF
jgi:outer membrane immunogenic protein